MQYAPTACGCDSVGYGPALLSVDEALAKISKLLRPVVGVETVPLERAKGRVLAQDVSAKSALPPFDNSAMDGYAIDAGTLTGDGPWRLPVVDRISAGHVGATPLPAGSAARIFTGAPIPLGADAVVMQENVERLPTEILLPIQPKPGAHIRRAGEELGENTSILKAGHLLGTRALAACAASGNGAVAVKRRLRVVLLITGDEVTPAGDKLSGGGIWDVNTPMLTAALSCANVDLVEITHCPDNRAQVIAQVQRLSDKFDLLITSGAVSGGEEDHVKPALKALGVETLFSGVAIKPGKPVSLGQIGSMTWLGLPGNPYSAFVTWQIFGTAVLRRLSGQAPAQQDRQIVRINTEINRKAGRAEYRPASFAGAGLNGYRSVSFANACHSARVTGLPFADGLACIPAETEHLPKGALVEFIAFEND